MEAIELLKQEGAGPEFENRTEAELIFLFIGGGALYEKLKGEVSKRRFSNVQFQPYQPRRHLAQSLSCADVHLVSLKPELEGLIVPSKFYGIAAAGRPTLYIGDPEGEIPRVLSDARCGLTVPIGDGAALAHHIQALATDPALCRAMGERARAIFEDRFEKNIAVEKWVALLGELS